MSYLNEQPEADNPESEDKETSHPREKRMGFFDHVDELRKVVVRSALVYLAFAVLIGVFLREFNDVLLWPFHQVQSRNSGLSMDLGTTTIMEGLNVVLQICFLGAAAPAAPFVFYFLAQFVTPALTEKELKLALPACLAGVFLFLIGASFAFFLLVPSTIQVALEVNQYLGYTLRWTPASYFSVLIWLVMGVGAAFEFPLLVVLLVYLGLIQVVTLRKYRRHAIVVIFIIAAGVTPTPDPLNQTLFALPLYVLYEVAILVGARIERKRLGAANS